MFGWNARKWIDWHSIRGGMRLEREIRSAFFLGESIDTVTRRLFYSERSDGSSLFTQERHELKMLARTAIQSAANAAAEATYENSRDVLSGMRIVATLDNRTCTQCGPLDGRLVKFGSKFPRPPFHPNCRCYLAPEVHADLLPGRNPRPPTWSQWITGEFAGLKPQAVKRRQLRVLGPTITNLIEDNRIAVSDLVTDRGKRRTAAQLVALSQTRSKARKAA